MVRCENGLKCLALGCLELKNLFVTGHYPGILLESTYSSSLET
jgi:hypothetical protein